MAQKINFNKDLGVKEYCFADDETAIIRVNTRDPNLYTRINEAKKELQKLADKYENFRSDNPEEISAMIIEFDTKVKEQIDYMFNSPVSEVAFGVSSSVAVYDGVPAFQAFLNAILPEVEKEIDKEQKKAEKNVSKYVSQAEKYK
jgi:hypothetical protein